MCWRLAMELATNKRSCFVFVCIWLRCSSHRMPRESQSTILQAEQKHPRSSMDRGSYGRTVSSAMDRG